MAAIQKSPPDRGPADKLTGSVAFHLILLGIYRRPAPARSCRRSAKAREASSIWCNLGDFRGVHDSRRKPGSIDPPLVRL